MRPYLVSQRETKKINAIKSAYIMEVIKNGTY